MFVISISSLYWLIIPISYPLLTTILSNILRLNTSTSIFHYFSICVNKSKFSVLTADRCTELLSMNAVLQYLIDSSESLSCGKMSDKWAEMVEKVRGTIVTKPGSVGSF